MRTDAAACTHAFLTELTRRGLGYSVGFYARADVATNTPGDDLPMLELRHRRRARVEDRIRCAKDTGLANLPYHDAASNQLWLDLVLLAQDLLAWTQLLALDGENAVAEPKRLRLHLFTIAGRLVRTARKTILDLDATWPWARDILRAIHRLQALSAPG